MPTEKRSQVRIKPSIHKAASSAAATHKLSLTEYTEAALDYFTSRQLNPADDVAREGQLIMQQVKKLGDRIFSYHQVQERDLLLPMLLEMLRTRITLDRVLVMGEIVANSTSVQLEQLPQAQLERLIQGLALLQKQNAEAIENLMQQARDSTKKPGKDKPEAAGQ